MNGATADPWLNTINAPNKHNTKMIGNSQNFFLASINLKISLMNNIINKFRIDFSLDPLNRFF